jgi:predicted RNA-binding protein with RPS1 domain
MLSISKKEEEKDERQPKKNRFAIKKISFRTLTRYLMKKRASVNWFSVQRGFKRFN